MCKWNYFRSHWRMSNEFANTPFEFPFGWGWKCLVFFCGWYCLFFVVVGCLCCLTTIIASVPPPPPISSSHCQTPSSGKIWHHSPHAKCLPKSNNNFWLIPPPLHIGNTCPAPIYPLIIPGRASLKQYSWEHIPHQLYLGWMARERGRRQETIPGSSRRDLWLEMVINTCNWEEESIVLRKCW